jgi:hypothetical protein
MKFENKNNTIYSFSHTKEHYILILTYKCNKIIQPSMELIPQNFKKPLEKIEERHRNGIAAIAVIRAFY